MKQSARTFDFSKLNLYHYVVNNLITYESRRLNANKRVSKCLNHLKLKFHERPFGASRIQANILAAGHLSRTPLGSLQRSLRTPTWRGTLPPLSAFRASGFGPSGLAANPKLIFHNSHSAHCD